MQDPHDGARMVEDKLLLRKSLPSQNMKTSQLSDEIKGKAENQIAQIPR